ncbi:type VI secretion system baseplate subunit TssF [Pseudomonas sp. SCB32]|uniref:type VI secretion system baseplate subunit TssF n=1 Tax=Pseudomonas sp. SCB32 TaxID=2653853 RepID=UPI0012649BB7|nr:type VI secretion system baseplate subunit TssF [Pseudomonas sp. SCB32]
MDELLDIYNRELNYLRELGAEFARAYPKAAGRLGLQENEVTDPYVERLLEGFSFLSARVQLKLQAQFPRFTQQLLDAVCPNYMAPLPAMAVVQFEPNATEGSLLSGFQLPAGTALRSPLIRGEQTACEFRTGHDCTLWPLRIQEAELCAGAPESLSLDLPSQRPVQAALRIRLQTCAGARFANLPLERLTFFVSGDLVQATRILELLLAGQAGVVCADPRYPTQQPQRLPDTALRHEGFAPEQALLPYGPRAFQGHRLLHEYFALPARFHFFSIGGLDQVLPRITGDVLDLFLLLDRQAPQLEAVIDADRFKLFCTPAINLFPKRADRTQITPGSHEFHVVLDRTRQLDYEVYSIEQVQGHRGAGNPPQDFRPLFCSHDNDSTGNFGAYFTQRREPRRVSGTAQRHGKRTHYHGSEIFLSLVDQRHAPFAEDLLQLSVDTLCSNRDLPLLMARGGDSDFSLKISAPVKSTRLLLGPSRPYPALAEDASAWRLIDHLSQNYLHLTDCDAEQGAAALRELLSIYGELGDPLIARQIHGLRSSTLSPIYRRLPQAGPIVYGRGIQVELTVDEAAFSGASPFVFCAVLEQFIARHVSINSFIELSLNSLQRGSIAAWQPRIGRRPVA